MNTEIKTIRKTKLMNEIIFMLNKKLYIKNNDDNWILREYINEVIENCDINKENKEICKLCLHNKHCQFNFDFECQEVYDHFKSMELALEEIKGE